MGRPTCAPPPWYDAAWSIGAGVVLASGVWCAHALAACAAVIVFFTAFDLATPLLVSWIGGFDPESDTDLSLLRTTLVLGPLLVVVIIGTTGLLATFPGWAAVPVLGVTALTAPPLAGLMRARTRASGQLKRMRREFDEIVAGEFPESVRRR